MAEFIYQMYQARKAHGDKVILDDVTLSFYPGAKIGVVGPNGMGKSTLLKIMAGIEEVSNGDARLTPGYTVGILQQEPPLDDDKTVIENVRMAFGDMIAKVDRFNKIGEEMCDPDCDMDALMAEMGKLQDEIDAADGWDIDSKLGQAMDALQLPDSDMPVNVLSGGERRRVALCKLLLEAPDLLLLDEPLSNLDAKLRIDMRAELQRLHKELGTTIIYVTHDQTEALTMSTKIALFKAGELNQVATPTELYNNPIDLEAADFIGNPRINLLDGKAEVINGQLVVKSDLGGHTFPAEHLTSEEFPKSGEFDCVLAIRPEQIAISTQPVEGAIPVTIYANQPAGSETITTLKAGTDEFLAKDIGQIRYDLDQKVWAIIDQDKINIYNKETTRLIKRAV